MVVIPDTRRAWRWLLSGLLLALCCSPVGAAQPPANDNPDAPLTFGILPIGGPAESLQAWGPMLEDMQKILDRPVKSISVSTYEGIAQAIAEQRVDVAFLSGELALDAVAHQGMQVVAQLTRTDGSKGYYAVLLVNRDGPIKNLADVFAKPGHWRLARGESLSVSGYLVPETQLFARRGLDSDTFFANVHIDNHENNALAVANNEADIATNNTADLERFGKHFPDQYQHLRIIWRSTLIPHAVVVVRTDLPAQLRQKIADFLTGYGAPGPNAERQRKNLLRIHDISGFAPARNAALEPFADIGYTLDRRRALTAQWVSAAAKRARLEKIQADHDMLMKKLTGPTPAASER